MMKHILVTGAKGFVGRNLCAVLNTDENIHVMEYDVDNTLDQLDAMIGQADFVFHLAGVNRPKDADEFTTGNAGLTSIVVDLLEKKGNQTPLMISSSTQAALDNPYGQSKKAAEDAAFAYGRTAKAYVFRFPGLFGKWSRPNYNSVVATFCHNIAHDLPIQINAPEAVIKLAYIDDVVEACLKAMNDTVSYDGVYACVDTTYEVSLQRLADLIQSFRDIRSTGVIPDMGDDFTRCLHSTYLSYLEEDNFGYQPTLHTDDRGWLFELLRTQGAGQIFVSKTKPGITRGNHYHHTKVEKFTVIQGQALIAFRKIDGDEVLEYKVNGDDPTIVDIPPGYTHNITNVGDVDVLTLFWSSELFNPERPDTIYEKV